MSRKLIQRITDAVTELRDPIATKTLGDIEVKQAPDYGRTGQNGNWGSDYRFTGWGNLDGRQRWNTNVDYKGEVGPLDGHSLVMAVVNYTGTRLPEAKPSVLRQDEKGKFQPDDKHELPGLIRRPNPFTVWANYCQALSLSLWIDGNVYFLKVRDLTGKVIELWYLPHFLVQPRWPNDSGNPAVPLQDESGKDSPGFLSHYQYSIPGKVPILYEAKDILHIKRGVNLSNPRLGLGAFEPLIKELYGDSKMTLFAATIMRNLGIVVPIISPKDKDVTLTEPQAEAIKQGYIQKTTGDRTGEPLINTVAVDIAKFGFSPSELDLSKLQLIPESRVAAVTGIPASTLQFLVGQMNGTSYASSEQARQQGYEEVVLPIQGAIAEEFNWQLIPEFGDDPRNVQFVFDTTKVRVLEEDRDALFRRESEALRSGGITINQFLSSIGKETVPDGDIYLIPAMSTPMTVDKLKDVAGDMTPPQAPPIDPAAAAKFADLERWFEGLEQQMKGFVPDGK